MTPKLSQVKQPGEWPTEVLPFVAMLAAIVALSLAAIFIKLSERELGPFATIFNRFWVAYLVLWVWHEWDNIRTPADDEAEDIEYTRRDQVLLIAAALMFWGCIALWAWSLTRTEVANSTLLHNLTPLFTTLGGWLLLHQQFDRRFMLGLAVAIMGAGALSLGDLQISASHLTGDIASLLSAVFSAANLMIIERLRIKFSVNIILQWCCLWGAIWTLPVVLLTEDRLFPISVSGWISVICLAVVCQVLGQGLQAFSLKRLSSGLVGILLLLDPVLAALTAWVLFAENLTLFKWTAFVVVLLGVYLAQSSDAAIHTADETA